MIIYKNNKGMASMVEVLVTAVIFTVAAFGIFSALGSISSQTSKSTKRLEAAYVAKGAFQSLRKEVDARTWNNANSLLAPGTRVESIGVYNLMYNIIDMPTEGVRKVTITVDYPELISDDYI